MTRSLLSEAKLTLLMPATNSSGQLIQPTKHGACDEQHVDPVLGEVGTMGQCRQGSFVTRQHFARGEIIFAISIGAAGATTIASVSAR